MASARADAHSPRDGTPVLGTASGKFVDGGALSYCGVCDDAGERVGVTLEKNV